MPEYDGAGDTARLVMRVVHDDVARELACGPAEGSPAAKVGAFAQVLCDDAMRKGLAAIGMKDGWKTISAFEQPRSVPNLHSIDERGIA